MAFGKAVGFLDRIRLDDGLRLHLEAAAVVGGVVVVAALFGVALRTAGLVAAVSPANAILLGMMVRFPHLATPAGWAAAVAGYVIADLLTGNSLVNTALLTSASMAGVAAGAFLLGRESREGRHLASPMAVLRLGAIALIAAAIAGLVGTLGSLPVLAGAAPARFAYWLVGELVNYLAILPVLLTLPDGLIRRYDLRSPPDFRQIDYLALAPMAMLVVACVASLYVEGPAALAFPLMALIWCALSTSVFTTAVLALLFGIWTIIAIALGWIAGWPELDEGHALVSVRLGVTLIGLAPIVVASVMAAHNALRNRFEQIASRDLLSGLLSRHAFVERSEQLLAVAARAQVPVAVLMLDIDHFKKINHTHGLGAGDRMIMTLAGVVTSTLSDADVIGRLGGEEFAALLAGATPAEATAAAERIRHVFAATPTDLGNGVKVEATLSIGIGCATQAPASIEPLLQVADEALSLAKGGGRNRIVRRDAVTLRSGAPM